MKALWGSLFMLAMAANCHAASAWKWVDEKGVTHYGDAPPPTVTKKQAVDTRPYGVTGGGGCGTCDWRALERRDREQPAVTSTQPARENIAQASARGMSYEVYIRLKPGMNEGELLARAGAPDSTAVEATRNVNVRGVPVANAEVKSYYYMPTPANPYVTKVTLEAGIIASIDRTKSN